MSNRIIPEIMGDIDPHVIRVYADHFSRCALPELAKLMLEFPPTDLSPFNQRIRKMLWQAVVNRCGMW